MSKFKAGMVISCNTLAQAKKLGTLLREAGYKWGSRSIEEDDDMNWDVYKDKTAYFINKYRGIEYSPTEWYEDNGYGKAIPFEKLFSSQSIHITVDGTTTVAVLKDGKQIAKREEAKLSPNDTFNFETGAEIAFNRLFGVEPFKPCDSDSECKNESNLYLCIKDERPGEWLTKGKVYEFDNGFTYDDGFKSSSKYTNFDEYKEVNPDFASCLQPINKNKESTPQVKEVKRKAKVGEWVKIVNPLSDNEQYYQKDDICKCIESKGDSDSGCYVTSRGTHPCNRGKNTSYLYNSEYVVLENYTPQQKTYTQAELDEAIKAERERIFEEVKKIFEKGK